jgi:D-amino-acid oxidase
MSNVHSLFPIIRPRSDRDRVLVVGAGVSGLTSALSLARAGIEVEVVAEKFQSDLVSVVAGALGEWPPAVCGYHRDQTSLARSKEWAMQSYEIFSDLARDPATGVYMRRANFYFTKPQTARELHKMHELAPKVRGFVRDPGLAEANGVTPETGIVDAYAFVAPMIDTDVYMGWLRRQVEAAGVTITAGRVHGRLADNEARLCEEFGTSAIVNCTGLGAAEMHGAQMYPLRGALVRVINDASRMPKVTEAHCVSHPEGSTEQDMVFIVPRGENMLLLGGLTEEGRVEPRRRVAQPPADPRHVPPLPGLHAGPRARRDRPRRAGPRGPAPAAQRQRLPRARAGHEGRPQLRPRRLGLQLLVGLRRRGRRDVAAGDLARGRRGVSRVARRVARRAAADQSSPPRCGRSEQATSPRPPASRTSVSRRLRSVARNQANEHAKLSTTRSSKCNCPTVRPHSCAPDARWRRPRRGRRPRSDEDRLR